MDGKDFLALALRLSANPNEPELRSAVSRAYYGAFHHAKSLLEECGITLPKSAQAHEKLVWCLAQCESEAIRLVRNELSTLRSERNLADYDLDSTKFRSQRTVQILVKAARLVFDNVDIGLCEPAFSEIRDAMRPYAKTIGLSVSDE